MEDNNAKELIKKYNLGTCTPEEKILVESWYLNESLINEDTLAQPNYQAAKDEIWKGIALKRNIKVKKISLLPRVAAAAVIIIAAGIAFYSYNVQHKQITNQTQVAVHTIKPGGNKATLTLADGRKINLEDADNGELAEQAGIRITKASNGSVIYNISKTISVTQGKLGAYNTIETPLGGQYQVSLPDGTNVWLNAASSLRYPIEFSGRERKVELRGEGYFEVAHNKEKPFIVVSAGQTVEVLGTHFNMNTYNDEPEARTTLLEGSVSVSNRSNVKMLKPGQQALLTRDNDIKVSTADIDQAMAWKNGDFTFEGVPLKTIMRQVCRWYNVEVVYQGSIADVEFGGSISRTKNINEVLKVLEMTQGVHFELTGRRILVTK
ncbi:DUF4974 domain-containing protein [Pedobacter hiemivivus]|uniref:DUF4974 domain-containing protein n=1 Tax=Pedobacter hiemivivus TaxID=2530454 RepID=A0A4U1FX55_9SPHI|nr:FecR domain-containing protein [Pedobacter hiemivivus]TKC55557.1 DUF4974 domain-containing protein [Pedobacter hiemivivus]